MQRRKAILWLALLGLATQAAAQTAQPLLQRDDIIPGIGGVRSVDIINVNDAKMWTAVVLTTFSNPNQDSCLLRSGFLSMREDMEIASPPGAILDDFDAVALNKRGDLATVLRIRLPGVAAVKEAAAWNLRAFAIRDDAFVDPLVPAGTVWNGFDVVRLNDRNQYLVAGDVKATIAPANRDILIRYQLDDLGNILSRKVILVRELIVPGLGGAKVISMPINENAFAFNNNGDVLSVVTMSTGAFVLRNGIDVLIADNTNSSVNRTWSDVVNSKVALNDRGDYLISGTVLGDANSNFLIEKNGEKFAQKGDILPALSDLPISGGSAAPLAIGNNGVVFWRTGIEGSTDEAYMRNYTPFLRRGQTVAGKVVTRLEILDTSYNASPNGRFFACGVDLDGGDTVMFVDFGLVLEIPGCFGNLGKLTHSGGEPRVGQFIEFAMDNGQVPGALARINFSSRLRIPNSECGSLQPYGELLLSRPHRLLSLFAPPWNGATPTKVGANIPPDLSLVNATLFAQGLFRSPSALQDVRLTNALRIEIGAP